jgi:hypothetical protein
MGINDVVASSDFFHAVIQPVGGYINPAIYASWRIALLLTFLKTVDSFLFTACRQIENWASTG